MKWMLAVDITDVRAAKVVEEAARWAAPAGAVVDVVHVEGPRYTYDFVTDPYVRDLMAAEARKMRAEDLSQLRDLLQTLPEANRGEAKLLPGRPVTAIVEAAPSYDAVLVGTHGRTGMAHFWLGSVAEQVVRRAVAPVLVLRLPKTA